MFKHTLNQRSIRRVPFFVTLMLFFSTIAQIAWSIYITHPTTHFTNLPNAPSQTELKLLSLGDTVSSAKLLMLWLQTFEHQGGKFASYRDLDYVQLQQWLTAIITLDPHAEYPLLAASHLYTTVPDKNKQVLMLEFIYTQFWYAPHERWQWLAHAAILAKHRLHDLPLALKYAQAIAQYASPDMPLWAQSMPAFILEEMGELEAARIVLGGLLTRGYIKDPQEINFLNNRLEQLEATPRKP